MKIMNLERERERERERARKRKKRNFTERIQSEKNVQTQKLRTKIGKTRFFSPSPSSYPPLDMT